MSNCVFCKISSGQIPCYKVYEDKDFLGFLDIHPRNPGHTLVIPKQHHRWVWDVPHLGTYYEVVGKLARALQKVLGTEWITSLVLGEEVPHAHVWLVPRFPNDGHGGAINISLVKDISPEEMQRIAERVRAAVEGKVSQKISS